MKIYYLTLSKEFPKGHVKAGSPTFFRSKVLSAVFHDNVFRKKIHTIRANYDFWAKRFEKIAAGEACLSIRQWVGKPYGKGSTQREITRFTREDGIGIEKLTFEAGLFYCPRIGSHIATTNEIAVNDGLSVEDWLSWFKGYDLSKPMAIIHFTKFRYAENNP